MKKKTRDLPAPPYFTGELNTSHYTGLHAGQSGMLHRSRRKQNKTNNINRPVGSFSNGLHDRLSLW